MKNDKFGKTLVFAIVFLFLGVSLMPCLSGINSKFDIEKVEDFDENIESYFQSLIDRITNIRERYLEYQDSLEHHRAYGRSHEKAAEEMKFLNGIKFFDLFKNTCKSGSRRRIVINLLRIYELYHLDTYNESELQKSINRLLSN